jgi:hypothetical protein
MGYLPPGSWPRHGLLGPALPPDSGSDSNPNQNPDTSPHVDPPCSGNINTKPPAAIPDPDRVDDTNADPRNAGGVPSPVDDPDHRQRHLG